MRLKLALVVGLLAAIVMLMVLSTKDQAAQTAPPAEAMTLESFIFTAKSGTPDELQAALDTGVDMNQVDRMGRTALTEALLVGSNTNAKALIEAGVNVTTPGRVGYTPLILACNNGDVDLVQSILDRRANPNRANDNGVTALHTACRSTADDQQLTAIVSALLNAGADANKADDEGFTPLMVAASRGRVDAMILLLDAGADKNAANDLGITPIAYAIMSGDFASRAAWEVDLSEPSVESSQKIGYLSLAMEQSNSLGAVRLLLSRGADINVQENNGTTPIMRAAGIGNIDRYKEVITAAGGDPRLPSAQIRLQDQVRLANAVEIVRILRNADAYVNVQNDLGADALTVSRMRTDAPGKLIHGLLLEGKRISQSEYEAMYPGRKVSENEGEN